MRIVNGIQRRERKKRGKGWVWFGGWMLFVEAIFFYSWEIWARRGLVEPGFAIEIGQCCVWCYPKPPISQVISPVFSPCPLSYIIPPIIIIFPPSIYVYLYLYMYIYVCILQFYPFGMYPHVSNVNIKIFLCHAFSLFRIWINWSDLYVYWISTQVIKFVLPRYCTWISTPWSYKICFVKVLHSYKKVLHLKIYIYINNLNATLF